MLCFFFCSILLYLSLSLPPSQSRYLSSFFLPLYAFLCLLFDAWTLLTVVSDTVLSFLLFQFDFVFIFVFESHGLHNIHIHTYIHTSIYTSRHRILRPHSHLTSTIFIYTSSHPHILPSFLPSFRFSSSLFLLFLLLFFSVLPFLLLSVSNFELALFPTFFGPHYSFVRSLDPLNIQYSIFQYSVPNIDDKKKPRSLHALVSSLAGTVYFFFSGLVYVCG